jgi:MFS family permease
MANLIYRSVSVVGAAQILASGATHYLPAVIAVAASSELGFSSSIFFAAYSLALAISGLAGPAAGRLVDRLGGRPVLMMSNVTFALGLSMMALSSGMLSLFLSFAVLGLGMAMGLFETAFSAIVRLFGKNSRNAITGITLFAGFASAFGWTVSVYVEAKYGWRGVCWFWTLLHLCVGLPLNAMLPSIHTDNQYKNDRLTDKQTTSSFKIQEPASPPEPSMTVGILLAFVFAVSSFIGMGLMSHLPRLLEGMGVPLAVAFSIGALVGPSQIAGRLLDFGFMRNMNPLISTRLAALAHPLGGALLLFIGGIFAMPFVILHGLGNGILIISRGTLPLALYGAKGYGQRQGWLMMPSKFAQAAAPFTFGLAVTEWGSNSLWLTWGLSLSVFVALCLIPIRPRT